MFDNQPIETNQNWRILNNFKTEEINLSLDMIVDWFKNKLAMNSMRKGRPLAFNQFVIEVKCCFQSAQVDFFKSVCKAEMKTKVSYTSYIQVDKTTNEILKANCMCAAGAGIEAACKHVAASLFVIEHYALTGLYF